jgi:hypothetical protein
MKFQGGFVAHFVAFAGAVLALGCGAQHAPPETTVEPGESATTAPAVPPAASTSPPAAGGPAPAQPASACGACTSWGAPVAHGALPAVLPESSGLAYSGRHAGVLYTHNDSGDSARFFAIDENANVLSEFHLDGVTAYDWEDIAVGPCPTGSCVYVADSGDGNLSRDHYTIYRIAEPEVIPTDGSAVSVRYESFHFVYPDEGGRHNSEALMVHPQTGRVFVTIKMGGRPSTYELPQPLVDGQTQTLVQVGILPLPPQDSIVTAADFHPCGDRMLVRTVQSLFELSAPGQPVEALFRAAAVKVPLASDEPQGEAVTYARDGSRYFTTSETGAHPQPLNIVSCANRSGP